MKKSQRALVASATLAVTAWLGACTTAPDLPQRPASTFDVAGLERPADVLIDRWGIPHVYAGTHYDAFVVQGFVAARDRLWQMDTWRKRGPGRNGQGLRP